MCVYFLLSLFPLQIHSTGGPSQANVVYSVNDSLVSRVDESGLVHAVAVGDALVTGQAEAEDSLRGNTVVYSMVHVCVCVCLCTQARLSTVWYFCVCVVY